jgi:hypothetical protein
VLASTAFANAEYYGFGLPDSANSGFSAEWAKKTAVFFKKTAFLANHSAFLTCFAERFGVFFLHFIIRRIVCILRDLRGDIL